MTIRAAGHEPPRVALLRSMLRLRCFEEAIAERYPEQKMRCPVHLSVGQEAVSAAVGLALEPGDLAVSGHRAHTHYLAKGGSMPRLLAEIYGKRTGCSRGKGGSMHLIDETVGFKGSTAIVAGTIPVGTGLGLSLSLRNTKQVACVFFGDAAVEEGVFFEAVNFAAVRRLPVLYVCENNFYSVYSPLRVRQPEGRQIHEMVSGLGVRAMHGDGNDPELVYRTTVDALDSIRSGSGPAFVEFTTYRYREHCGPNFDNDIGYRTEAEFLRWRAADPVEAYERRLLDLGTVTSEAVRDMRAEIAAEVADAFAFAEHSAFPDAAEAYCDLYAGEDGT
ncbi:MAG: thiamine pyrophosphate-dependent dehydrogenase E1 component subunit alpha [Planctomycetaceae bacterium]|jgi:TPP-dependent pyruvate/acetoin dehydrogenase alpha subunit|nr:thiamine pyrophosphate-dependent dehydrogenase E1 component subunit alpha [Planctomycetaceae bacterium]